MVLIGFDCIHQESLWFLKEKLKDLAEKLNRHFCVNWGDYNNEVIKLINGLYKCASKNFGLEKEAEHLIRLWRGDIL